MYTDVVPELVVCPHFCIRECSNLNDFQSFLHLFILQQFGGYFAGSFINFRQEAEPKCLHFLFGKRLGLELWKFYKNQMKSVNNLVCIFVVDKMVVVVIVIDILLEYLIDKVQCVYRLKTLIVAPFR